MLSTPSAYSRFAHFSAKRHCGGRVPRHLKMINVLHLSTTPLVGAPGNQCRALNESGLARARWAVLDDSVGQYKAMAFDLDLTWARNRDEIVALAQVCDVLHLHNFIDLQTQAFEPLDFGAFRARGKPMVRQFHSQPGFVAKVMSQSEEAIQACPIPKLVIAQYPERGYPTAALVRNLVYVPPRVAQAGADNRPVRVGYAPSRFNSAHTSRWDTKGYPETLAVLRRLKKLAARRGLAVELDVIEHASHAECLRRKALCDLFVDDLATGSYHLNTLEALAMGVPCATFLDGRIRRVLREVTGGAELPVLDVGLEDAADVMAELCARPETLRAMGHAARNWMDQHWAPFDVAAELSHLYQQVLERPGEPFPRRFDPSDPLMEWAVRSEHDVRWRARRRLWPAAPNPLLQRARAVAGRVARSLGLVA